MEKDLRALLLASTGVTALTGTRVTWGERPQGSLLPAVLMHLVGGAKGYSLTGEAGPFATRVQVNSLADGYLGALTLFRAIAAALSGYSGTFGVTAFQGILQDGEPSDLSQPEGATEQRIFGITADFIVHHTPQE